MQLIWYNSEIAQYQFGNPEEFESVKANFQDTENVTVLMELPLGDHNLANKVIYELNVASSL